MGWFASTSQSSDQYLGDITSLRKSASYIQSRLNKLDFICLDQIIKHILNIMKIIHQEPKAQSVWYFKMDFSQNSVSTLFSKILKSNVVFA